jgi:hypothetical protein
MFKNQQLLKVFSLVIYEVLEYTVHSTSYFPASTTFKFEKIQITFTSYAVDILLSLIEIWNSHLIHSNRKVEYLAVSLANRLQQVFHRIAALL